MDHKISLVLCKTIHF